MAARSRDARPEWRSVPIAVPHRHQILGLSAEARLLDYVLRVRLGPLGLEALPAAEAQLAELSGLEVAAVALARDELVRQGLLVAEAGCWWLTEALEENPNLAVADQKHRLGVRRRAASLPAGPVLGMFLERYRAWWSDDLGGWSQLADRCQLASGRDGPSPTRGRASQGPPPAPSTNRGRPSEAPAMTGDRSGKGLASTHPEPQPDPVLPLLRREPEAGPAGEGWRRFRGLPGIQHRAAAELQVLEQHLSPVVLDLVADLAGQHKRPAHWLIQLRSVAPDGARMGGPGSTFTWSELGDCLLAYAGSPEFDGPPAMTVLDGFLRRDRADRSRGVARETGAAQAPARRLRRLGEGG